MNEAISKHRRLVYELAATRVINDLLPETWSYFTQAINDCYKHMSKNERAASEAFAAAVLADGFNASCMTEATDAVRQADQALQLAIVAFERLRDAEVDLAKVSTLPERDVANRGYARADQALCVLRALGME